MSNILDRLKNLENERPTVLGSAAAVPSRRQIKKSRKPVVLALFTLIAIAVGFLGVQIKMKLSQKFETPVPVAVDLSHALDQKNQAAVDAYEKADYKASTEAFESLVKQVPDKAEFHVNLAMSYQQLAKFEEAKKELKRAIELDPKNSVALNNLGLIAAQQKENKLAEESLKKAFDLNDQSPEITLNLASFYEKTGRLKKSVEAYQRYVALPKADKSTVNLIKKRLPRLNSLSAQLDEDEGT